jgi:hypothetical protein
VSRTRALTAATALGALLVLGIGSAQAVDNAATAGGGSNSTTVTNWGSGNIVGSVTGNSNGAQQVGTGSGASNQNNTTLVNGASGNVSATQGNTNTRQPDTANAPQGSTPQGSANTQPGQNG